MSADDDAEVLRKLAALDAEVKADADKLRAQATRKAEIIAELRRREAAKQAASAPKPEAKPAPVAEAPRPKPKPVADKPKRKALPEPPPDDVDVDDAIETAMTVARGAKMARAAKAELSKPREEHEKSWVASGLLSLFFGPVGWLYAGALRETIPAAFFWLVAAAIATKLPMLMFLVVPVLLVALPLSAIGGVVYAAQYNRHGKRQRLFGKDPEPEPKKLQPGKPRRPGQPAATGGGPGAGQKR